MKYFAVIFFALNIWLVYCKIINQIKCYKVECKFSEEFFANGSCNLKPVNRLSTAFNGNAYLKHPVANFVSTLRVFRRYNIFLPFPVNLKVKPCDYLSGQTNSYLYSIAKVYLAKYSNVNHTCPYVGELIAKNVEFIPKIIENLTTIIPEGIYRVDVNSYKGTEENFIFFGSAYFEVKEVDTKRRIVK